MKQFYLFGCSLVLLGVVAACSREVSSSAKEWSPGSLTEFPPSVLSAVSDDPDAFVWDNALWEQLRRDSLFLRLGEVIGTPLPSIYTRPSNPNFEQEYAAERADIEALAQYQREQAFQITPLLYERYPGYRYEYMQYYLERSLLASCPPLRNQRTVNQLFPHVDFGKMDGRPASAVTMPRNARCRPDPILSDLFDMVITPHKDKPIRKNQEIRMPDRDFIINDSVTYHCDRHGETRIYNKNIPFIDSLQYKPAGGRMYMPGEGPRLYITVPKDIEQAIYQIVQDSLSPEDYELAKNGKLMIALYIDSSTAKIIGAEFSFFNRSVCTQIPPEHLYPIEARIKESIRFFLTPEGRSYNYNIYAWIYEDWFN